MIKGKRVLAVVPARGGSKGLPKKNLIPINGVPLVAMVGEVLKKIKGIDRAVVSTDCEDIAQVAINSGIEASFRRPSKLSGDRIGDYEVLLDALMQSEAIYREEYDVIVMLQPTSPLRQARDVLAAIEKLIMDACDSVWTVSLADLKYHPLKQLMIEDDSLSYYDVRGEGVIARQQLTPLYYRNGVAYAISRNCLVNKKSIKGDNAKPIILDSFQISIDTIEDLQKAERYLELQTTTSN